MVTKALREAMRAVANARSIFPLIDPRGIGVYHTRYVANQHSFHTSTGLGQVATAVAFLRAVPPVKAVGSYGLKHDAERWGRAQGLTPYVSNGALIAAALYLDIPIDGNFEGEVWLG